MHPSTCLLKAELGGFRNARTINERDVREEDSIEGESQECLERIRGIDSWQGQGKDRRKHRRRILRNKEKENDNGEDNGGLSKISR